MSVGQERVIARQPFHVQAATVIEGSLHPLLKPHRHLFDLFE